MCTCTCARVVVRACVNVKNKMHLFHKFFFLSLFFCYGKKWIGRDIEQAFIETIIGPIDDRQQYFYPHNFICLPCEPGCRDCDDDQPCFIKFDQTFRIIVLIIQLFCIIIAILIALLTFRLRYTKVCIVIESSSS